MLRTHCQTSGVSLQEQDPYNNVIRTAYEAMSAVLGGTQSLHTNALDEAIAYRRDFSARIARNTQLILARRNRRDQCRRSTCWLYYVEKLTAIWRGWKLIEEVEEMGGMTKAVAIRHAKTADRRSCGHASGKIDRWQRSYCGR